MAAPESSAQVPFPGQPGWLALILVCGALLRLAGLVWGQAYNPDAGQADGLEAVEVAVAWQQGERPAQYLGQPRFRVGSKLPGPAWTLVCVAGLQLGGSAMGIAWLLAGANLAAIFLIYRLACLTVGPRAALLAAALVAVGPLAVQNSIVVFNPALLPLLATWLFLALWRVAGRDRSRAIAWVVFLLALLPQFHMAALLLGPAILLVLCLSGRPVHGGWLAAGLLGGAILYLPYVQGEAAQGWANTRAMFAAVPGNYHWDLPAVLVSPARFLVSYWAPASIYTAAERAALETSAGGAVLVQGMFLLSALLALLLTAGVAGRAAATWGGPAGLSGGMARLRGWYARDPGLMFLLILFLVPLTCGLWGGLSFRPRYCLLVLGPLAALFGAGAVHWLERPAWRIPVAAGLAVVLLWNGWFMVAIYRYQERHLAEAPRFLGSFPRLEEIYRSLRRAVGQGGRIEVDKSGYRAAGGAETRGTADVDLIPRYVALREKERAALGPVRAFAVRPAREAEAGASWSGNGVVIAPK